MPRARLPGITLLRTNRQIHHEAAAVLYGSYRFMIACDELDLFLEQIGLANTRLIRHIQLWIHPRLLFPNALRACSGLRTLDVCLHPEKSWGLSSTESTRQVMDQLDIAHRNWVDASDVRATIILAPDDPKPSRWNKRAADVISRAKSYGWGVRRVWLTLTRARGVVLEAEEDF